MPRRDRRRAARPMAVEQLETRRVLASAIQAGMWTIRGDRDPLQSDDVIVVDRNPADAAQLRATVNGVLVGVRPEARVRMISVLGGRGDDTITIAIAGNTRIRTVLDGGRGDDTIIGAAGRDLLRGGPGKDTLRGGGGTDELWGGSGDDDLAGGQGNDLLRGESGRDTLRGGQGRNTLVGGSDRDTVYGVAGVDVAVLARDEQLIGNESTNPLRVVSGADDLKTWFIDTAMQQWGPQLGMTTWSPWLRRDDFGGGIVASPTASPAAQTPGQSPADSGDFSGTNNQVAGVDEADLVKTDGHHLYVMAGDGVDIVRAWPAEELAVVSHLAIDGREQSLFLHGTTLTVLSQMDGWQAAVAGTGRLGWFGTWQPKVAVTVVDVADPTQPVIRERSEIDGWLVSARAIGARVIVVAQDDIDIPMPGYVELAGADPVVPDGAPRIGSDALLIPGIWGPYGSSYVFEDEASYRNRLEAAWEAGVLPGFSIETGGDTETGLLVDAGQAYVPVKPQDTQFLSVVSFVVDDEAAGPESVTSVGGGAGTVYASSSTLYVAATAWGAWWDSSDAGVSTNVYAFDLTESAIPLVAMGAVEGMVLDQFSIDEHEGLLRIATTTWGWSPSGGESSSGVSVLRVTNGNLQLVGAVTGLAPGERIYSARFAGDQAYVSTFRQIDPFYVIDLSDPAAPKVSGELKIPGYSSYLQRLDDGHVLGVGRDVDPDTGRVLGIQLSLFDVSDPRAPRRVATHTFPGEGWSAWSEALWNHLAISWFPEQGILALPLEQGAWSAQPSNSLVVLRIDLGSAPGFTPLGEIVHDDPVRRSLRIGTLLYSVSGGEVQVHRLDDPADARGRARLAVEPPPPPFVWIA